jgi:hypothetical protein
MPRYYPINNTRNTNRYGLTTVKATENGISFKRYRETHIVGSVTPPTQEQMWARIQASGRVRGTCD